MTLRLGFGMVIMKGLKAMKWVEIKKDGLPQDQDSGDYVVYAKSQSENGVISELKTMAWFSQDKGWTLIPTVWIPFITHWMKIESPSEENLIPIPQEHHKKFKRLYMGVISSAGKAAAYNRRVLWGFIEETIPQATFEDWYVHALPDDPNPYVFKKR